MEKGTTKKDPLVNEELGSEASESLWERVEKTYKSSERQYRLLAENISDVIWTMDADYRFTYISPSVIHMRGYSAEEAILQSLEETFTTDSCHTIYQHLNEVSFAEMSSVTIMDRSLILELDQLCRDGSVISTETRISCLRNTRDKHLEFLGVARDVTERKRIEDQIKQSELLASLGKMTAGIAHEVNNPLGSILLFSELIMKNGVSEEVKADLKVIHDEAKRAARVMSDLLTYSLGGSNKTESIDLIKIIGKVLDMRTYAESVRNITSYFEEPDSPLYVYGDRSQISQVFMNILLNSEEALEANKGGNIYVTATASDGWARVIVTDDGPGIPEEYLHQVFYPFFTTKGIGDGTGLGLSTCYGIVTSHGGLIKAENNPSGGVKIVVEFPLL